MHVKMRKDRVILRNLKCTEVLENNKVYDIKPDEFAASLILDGHAVPVSSKYLVNVPIQPKQVGKKILTLDG